MICSRYRNRGIWEGRVDLMRSVVLGFAIAAVFPTFGIAQQCGDPPVVSDKSLKAELDGQAKLLYGKIGDVGLKGDFESARTDVLAKYPNADKVRNDTYMLYQICMAISGDAKLTGPEKVQLLLQVQKAMNPPALK
jgi:hypothetical protein